MGRRINGGMEPAVDGLELDVEKSLVNNSEVKAILDKISIEYQINEPTQPSETPAFPSDVTKLDSESVGRHYACYESEVAYIRYRLAVTEAYLDYGKNVLSTFKKRLYLAFRGEYSKDEAEAWVEVNNSVVQGSRHLQSLEAEKTLLSARYDIFSKYAASMSREITRRKQDFEKDGFSKGSKNSSSDVKGLDIRKNYYK